MFIGEDSSEFLLLNGVYAALQISGSLCYIPKNSADLLNATIESLAYVMFLKIEQHKFFIR